MYLVNHDKIPAAMYIRMSTEHQKYSPENQAAAIKEYADRNGYEIIKTYTDGGKIEATKIMIESKTFTTSFARSIWLATPDELLAVPRRRKKSIVMDFSHFTRLEEEISRLHGEYEEIEENYGVNVLNFTLVKGYIKNLVMNPRVNRYLRINNPEILEHLEGIVDIDNLNTEE